MRVKYNVPDDLRIAVFVRSHDGPLQSNLVGSYIDEHLTTIYALFGCHVRPTHVHERVLQTAQGIAQAEGSLASNDSEPLTVTDLDADVLIFINRPIEVLNHTFVKELAAQAYRQDCGVVTGISIDEKRRILHSGFIPGFTADVVDIFRGLEFGSPTYMGQSDVVRTVSSISDHFFATRPEHLVAIGGLATLSESTMQKTVSQLTMNARKKNLRVLVTPYAVATFENSESAVSPVVTGSKQSDPSLNRNLLAFTDENDVFKINRR